MVSVLLAKNWRLLYLSYILLLSCLARHCLGQVATLYITTSKMVRHAVWVVQHSKGIPLVCWLFSFGLEQALHVPLDACSHLFILEEVFGWFWGRKQVIDRLSLLFDFCAFFGVGSFFLHGWEYRISNTFLWKQYKNQVKRSIVIK